MKNITNLCESETTRSRKYIHKAKLFLCLTKYHVMKTH